MARKHALQQTPVEPQADLRVAHQITQPPQLRRPRRVIESPWFNSREAMQFLGFDSISVLYYHIRENGLPHCRIGGRYRFNRLALTAWVEGPQSVWRAI